MNLLPALDLAYNVSLSKMNISSSFRLKPLLICNLVIVFLITSWLFPPTRALWDQLDLLVFRLLNGSLEGNPSWQYLWALANLPAADWPMDALLLLVNLHYIFLSEKGGYYRRAFKILVIGLYIFLIVMILNKWMLHVGLHYRRLSPSLVVEHAIRLSEVLNWPGVRDHSKSSFPGDHALVWFMWAALTTACCPKRYGIIAWSIAILFSLPRLFSGAHWLTDDLIGSGSLTLFAVSWLIYTPLFLKLRLNR